MDEESRKLMRDVEVTAGRGPHGHRIDHRGDEASKGEAAKITIGKVGDPLPAGLENAVELGPVRKVSITTEVPASTFFAYDPSKITPEDMAKVLDSKPGAIMQGPLPVVEFMPAPIYRLDVPAGGRGLIVCDDPVDADAIRRSFQVRRIPLESCVYGANLTGERFGLIIIAKRPKDDGQERWLKEVVEPCLAKDGTLRRLYV